MQHIYWQELIPFYIAKTLPPEQQQAFEQHLATCSNCAHEIKQWRTIAAAVWQEAESAAKQVPPLSQEVYNRLNYADRVPSSRYSANPPRPDYVPKQALTPPQRQQANRKITLPLTMVAGTVVAFLFGALLISLALREQPEPLANTIALNATGTADAYGAMGIQGGEATATITPNPEITEAGGTGGGGILPTPMVIGTPTPTPFTPINTLPPNSGGGSDTMMMVETGIAPATQAPIEPPFAAIGGGPYITLTPGIEESGVFQCFLFNPTTVPIDGYAQANYGAPITASINPREEYRTLVRSVEGWYQVFIAPGSIAWIPPQTAYLSGNCDAAQFWIPTPTQSAQSLENNDAIINEASGNTSVVVEAAFANFYSGPGFNYETIDVTERGSQFAILAYAMQGNDQWIQVLTADGQARWLWGAVVTEYDNADLPQNP
jgi:hypothetical protein